MTVSTGFGKYSAFITLFTVLMSSHISSFAAQEYKLGDDKIRAIISSNKINRIEFDAHGIAQVIGDNADYQYTTDNRGMNIFLKKQQPGKANIELSLVTNSGQAVDLVLTPVDNMEGQTIRIKSIPQDFIMEGAASLEIKHLLSSMIRDEENKYYVRKTQTIIDSVKTSNPKPNLRIIQDRIYRYKDLIGTRLVVTNRNKKRLLFIDKKDFSRIFQNVVAVHIEESELSPGSKTHVWLVSKEADND